MAPPELITGGCLCGSVRYEVRFRPDHDWETSPRTCQCTQCRKNSGCLVVHFHDCATSELTWTSKTTLATYSATPGNLRWFCTNCGGFLAWGGKDEMDTDIEITVGTVDEKWLLSEGGGEDGKGGEGHGLALANPASKWFWSLNEIKGVTDGHQGIKYAKGSRGGPME